MPFLYNFVLIPISRLPFWLLYIISDVLYFILYRIASYRKKVVRSNIENSFPSLTKEKHREIEKEFYSHFCDLIVESIKAFTISKEELNKRFKQNNVDLFQKYFDKGQDLTCVGGHINNWELYAVSIGLHMPHKMIALYTPLTNKYLNKKILGTRTMYGLNLMPYQTIKDLMEEENRKSPVAVIFGTDQCPKYSQKPYWLEFLNQETAVQFGAENFARKHNTPVIYGAIFKIKRGYYEARYKLVCEKPNDLPIGELTKRHTKILEDDIKDSPQYWLWTHKRWKRPRVEFEKRATQTG